MFPVPKVTVSFVVTNKRHNKLIGGIIVEELICLATWKEGSTKYLIGKIAQGSRRSLTSDEDQYRCFIYQRGKEDGKIVYNIAQSGDATCSGLQSSTEGSRTMKFTIGMSLYQGFVTKLIKTIYS